MGTKVTLGGNRLGAGNKMQEELHSYETTAHNLSYIWKSTMTTGTLVPFMVEVMTNGDYCTIDLDTLIRTHPTMGALFGSFKVQLDVFKAPIRHYNKSLHNNTKQIGLQMQNITFPQMLLTAQNITYDSTNIQYGEPGQQQIASDSLLAYLGIRSIGRAKTSGASTTSRYFNAIPLLMYWDIYGNYYANQQELIGYQIAPIFGTEGSVINRIIDTNGISHPNTEEGITAPMAEGIKYLPLTNNQNNTGVKILGKGVSTNTTINIEIGGTSTNTAISAHATAGRITAKLIGNTGIEIWGIGSQVTYLKADETNRMVTGLTGTRISTTPILGSFNLSNIDEMRSYILATSGTVTIPATNHPYQRSIGTTTIGDQTFSRSTGIMAGLGIKTYQSDRFNNWLNNSWNTIIKNTSRIQMPVESISKIDKETGEEIQAAGDYVTLTMDALNLQQKIYNLLNRIVLSGNTYKDWQEATWGHKGVGDLEIPEWCGGCSSEIVFDEVVSTAGSTGYVEPLGTLAGHGRQTEHKKNIINIRCNEPQFIMGIISITPRIDYCQGNRWFMRLNNINELHKPELDGIGFQDLITDEMAGWNTRNMANIPTYTAAGKQLAWTEYTTNVNQTHGNFSAGREEEFMVLNREYEMMDGGTYESPNIIQDLSTYIDPVMYNKAFATQTLDSQHFWVQVGVGLEMHRVMGYHQIPQL